MSIMKNVLSLLVCIVFVMCACEYVTATCQDFKVMASFRENMDDTGKPFIDYECTAEMDVFNRLSWYQIKGSKHMLLNMTQQQDIGRVNNTVTLHMTLLNSDQNSEVYCLKENRTKQQTYFKEIVRWIQLSFTRTIPLLEKAQASIKPNAKVVYFDMEKALTFVCQGTAPTDGRKLTWYFENYANSELQSDEVFITPQFEIAESQKYDSEKNEAVLQLSSSESNHLKRLFCAQDIHVQVIEDNGKNDIVRFAQRVRSETVTLILRDTAGSHAAIPWWSTVLVAILALIFFVALVIVIKQWKRKVAEFNEMERLWTRAPLQTPNEEHYDTVYSHGAGLLRRPKI